MLESTYNLLKEAFYANRMIAIGFIGESYTSDEYDCFDDDQGDDDDADCFCG